MCSLNVGNLKLEVSEVALWLYRAEEGTSDDELFSSPPKLQRVSKTAIEAPRKLAGSTISDNSKDKSAHTPNLAMTDAAPVTEHKESVTSNTVKLSQIHPKVGATFIKRSDQALELVSGEWFHTCYSRCTYVSMQDHRLS